MVFAVTHSGEGGFSVVITGESGDELASIVTVGEYVGLRGHSVDLGNPTGLLPGVHRIQILADGPWTIKISQDFPSGEASNFQPPLKIADRTGDYVFRWVGLPEGEFVVLAGHLGTQRFAVQLVAADGKSEVVVVDDVGEHESTRLLTVAVGSRRADLAPGFFALVVQADGTWEVSIE